MFSYLHRQKYSGLDYRICIHLLNKSETSNILCSEGTDYSTLAPSCKPSHSQARSKFLLAYPFGVLRESLINTANRSVVGFHTAEMKQRLNEVPTANVVEKKCG